jgi:hypothetical protein
MSKRCRFSDEELNRIYDRTNGKCHLCHRRLAFRNYGAHGKLGAWHVEHSLPLARGGTNFLLNLYGACIRCNLEKSTRSTRTARAWAGKSRAPLSRERRASAKEDAALLGGVVGAGLGAALTGRHGLLLGAVLGAVIGYSQDPDD